MTVFTHEIVRMERGATKNSGSPMWRCQTKDGQKVNVFQHSDPAKDNTELFRTAGYFGYMESLRVGEAVEWSQSPIWVVMEKDGDWWAVTDVGTKPHDAERKALWQQYQAARVAINSQSDSQKRKHLEEALYAEDGIAWRWARVDADYCQMGGS